MRTRQCDESVTTGRLHKAQQFFQAATMIRDLADDESELGDAFVTLCVHAGIAAADAICCAALGEHAMGENHTEAVRLLRRVSPHGDSLGQSLHKLLTLKTRAGYSDLSVNAEMRRRAQRAAEHLVTAAGDLARR